MNWRSLLNFCCYHYQQNQGGEGSLLHIAIYLAMDKHLWQWKTKLASPTQNSVLCCWRACRVRLQTGTSWQAGASKWSLRSLWLICRSLGQIHFFLHLPQPQLSPPKSVAAGRPRQLIPAISLEVTVLVHHRLARVATASGWGAHWDQ